MQVKSIVECILQYFWPALRYHMAFRPLFCLFLSGHFRQVSLYICVWEGRRCEHLNNVLSKYIVCVLECMHNWAVTCHFQQCGILTSGDSYEPVQPPVKLRNSKCCSVSSLGVIEYSSDKQRLWSDCTYAQADQRLCWSHIPHCWKSHVTARFDRQY